MEQTIGDIAYALRGRVRHLINRVIDATTRQVVSEFHYNIDDEGVITSDDGLDVDISCKASFPVQVSSLLVNNIPTIVTVEFCKIVDW